MKIKNIFSIGSTAFACLSLVLLCGCANRKDKAPELELSEAERTAIPPEASTQTSSTEKPEPKITKAPSMDGKEWSGYYYRTDQPGRLALTATIKQGKTEIKLTTFRSKDKVHNLIGSIAPDGQVTLEDKLQPSIWTSSFGPATANTLKIVAPIGDEGTPASQIITLRR